MNSVELSKQAHTTQSRVHLFLGIVLLLSTLLLSVSASSVWITDPYGRLVADRGVEAVLKDTHAIGGPAGWYAKAILMRNTPHDAVIIGSSKIMYIDPGHLHQYEFFNASLGGNSPELMKAFLESEITDENLVLMGLDFFMVNEAKFPLTGASDLSNLKRRMEQRSAQNQRRFDLIEGWHQVPYLLSLDALRAAWTRPETRTPEDMFLRRGNLNLTARLARINTWEKRCLVSPDLQNYTATRQFLRLNHYEPFIFSETRIRVLAEIRDLMMRKGTPLKVLLNPVNILDRRLIHDMGFDSRFDRYRAEVKTIFPDAADFTSGAYGSAGNYFPWDIIHFKPAYGAALLQGLVAGTPVEPSNPFADEIDSHSVTTIATYPDSSDTAASTDGPSRMGRAEPTRYGAEFEFVEPQTLFEIEVQQTGQWQSYVKVQYASGGGEPWVDAAPKVFCTPPPETWGKTRQDSGPPGTLIFLPNKISARRWRIHAANADGTDVPTSSFSKLVLRTTGSR